jgi:hypothetical protein
VSDVKSRESDCSGNLKIEELSFQLAFIFEETEIFCLSKCYCHCASFVFVTCQTNFVVAYTLH